MPGEWARTCPHCGTGPTSFQPQPFIQVVDTQNQPRRWQPGVCPVCGGVIVAEIDPSDHVKNTYPSAIGEWDVGHLPPDVARDWEEARNVYRVRAYAAAVVMCGRTLEAAADALGVSGPTLGQRISKMLHEGLITRQFKDAMSYVRLIRNTGAHAGAVLSRESAEGTMRFTLQALRLLFEVPGELDRLAGEPPEVQGTTDES